MILDSVDYLQSTEKRCKRSAHKGRKSAMFNDNHTKTSVSRKYIPLTAAKSPLSRCSRNKSLTDSSEYMPRQAANRSGSRNAKSFCSALRLTLGSYPVCARSVRNVEIAFLLLKREFDLLLGNAGISFSSKKEQMQHLNDENKVMRDKLTDMNRLLTELIDYRKSTKQPATIAERQLKAQELHNAHRMLYNTELEYHRTLRRYEQVSNPYYAVSLKEVISGHEEGIKAGFRREKVSNHVEDEGDSMLVQDICRMQIELATVSSEVAKAEKIMANKRKVIENTVTKYRSLKDYFNHLRGMLEETKESDWRGKFEELAKLRDASKATLNLIKTRCNLARGEYVKQVNNLAAKKNSLISSMQMHERYFFSALIVFPASKEKD